MGIALHAKAKFLDDVFVKTKCSPTNIVKQAFKNVGLDMDKPYSECSVKQSDRNGVVEICIHNPDCYVDKIHLAFKYLTKRQDITRCFSIQITDHYY